MTLASGTRVSLRYVREATRGVTPAGVGTPVTNLASGTGSATEGELTRSSGSFVTDGFLAGQWIETYGFTNSNNNGTWKIKSVTATVLTVEDENDDMDAEVADPAQTCAIILNDLRATGRSMNPEKGILESAEVRPDRQKYDVRHGFEQAMGSPGFELSLKSYDDFLELLFSRAWVDVAVTGGPNFGCDSSGYFSRSAGSFITDGFRAGDIIRTASFANSANNGDFRVTAVSATQLTVDASAVTMVTEAPGAGPTLIYPGKRLDVGAVLNTLTVERAFADVTQYQAFLGVCLDQMSLSVQPEAIIGGTFNLLGMVASAMSSSPLSARDPKEAFAYSPFAAFDGKIYEGGSLIAVATGFDMSFVNNRSLNPVIGSKTSPDVFEGTMELTGTLTAYFEDEVLFNKFINETESSLWMKLQDPNTTTDFMSIVIPRVKYNGGEMDPPQEGPVPLTMPFRGLVKQNLAEPSSATVDSSITIQRSNTY